jgi:hypothetical protein
MLQKAQVTYLEFLKKDETAILECINRNNKIPPKHQTAIASKIYEQVALEKMATSLQGESPSKQGKIIKIILQ